MPKAQTSFASLGLQRFTPTVRSTRINDRVKCARFDMWRHIFGLTSERPSLALNLGIVYHAGLASYYKTGSTGMMEQACEFERDRAKTALVDHARDDGTLPWGESVSNAIRRVEEAYAKGAALARWAVEQHPLDAGRYTPYCTEQLVEVSAKDGSMVPIRGRIDLVLLDEKDKTLWIVDHKTTGDDPTQRAMTLPFETQPMLYRWLMTLKLRGTRYENRLRGCIHTIIKSPTIRQTQKEDFPGYLARLKDRYNEDMRKHKELGAPPVFVYSQIPYEGEAYTEELHVKLTDIQRATTAEPTAMNFPRNDASCFKFRRPCQFLPLCRAKMQDIPELIQLNYKVSPRDADDESQHPDPGDDE